MAQKPATKMRIKILRGTVIKTVGAEFADAVVPGTVAVVDVAQGRMLIKLGKAVEMVGGAAEDEVADADETEETTDLAPRSSRKVR